MRRDNKAPRKIEIPRQGSVMRDLFTVYRRDFLGIPVSLAEVEDTFKGIGLMVVIGAVFVVCFALGAGAIYLFGWLMGVLH